MVSGVMRAAGSLISAGAIGKNGVLRTPLEFSRFVRSELTDGLPPRAPQKTIPPGALFDARRRREDRSAPGHAGAGWGPSRIGGTEFSGVIRTGKIDHHLVTLELVVVQDRRHGGLQRAVLDRDSAPIPWLPNNESGR